MKLNMMTEALSELQAMRKRQKHLDSLLGATGRENAALCRQLVILKEKHLKQQEIVNKVMYLLATVEQRARSGGLPPEASPTGLGIHELDGTEHDLDYQYIISDNFENHSDPSIQISEQEDQSSM